jgi:hypothetical protein
MQKTRFLAFSSRGMLLMPPSSGKTGLVIGALHDRFIHVPIELLATQQKRLDPDSPA